MPTTAEYLNDLVNQKNALADNLNAKGIDADRSETLNTLVPKVLEIESGDTETAYNNGFEDGKKAEWNEFWDNYQDYGNKKEYNYTFAGYGWNDKTFKPKYDIVLTTGTHTLSSNAITDFVARLAEAGVVLDMSKNTSTSYFMQGNNYTTTLPVLDIRSRKQISYFISNNNALKSIEKIILKDDGSQTFNDWSFNGNTALEHIRFEGKIGNNLAIADSPNLTHDSLTNIEGTGILDCLKDFSGTTTTRTLKLHANAIEKLSDKEKAIATQKGWNLA